MPAKSKAGTAKKSLLEQVREKNDKRSETWVDRVPANLRKEVLDVIAACADQGFSMRAAAAVLRENGIPIGNCAFREAVRRYQSGAVK